MNASATIPFIPVCCVCGLAREAGAPRDSATETWSNFQEYLSRHGLRGTEYRLTHAYCPVCVNEFIPARKKPHCEDIGPSAQAGDITALILETVRVQQSCGLDALSRLCSQLTWNQIFLEVDRLSRSGQLRLTMSTRCGYEVALPLDHRTAERFDHDGESERSSIGEVPRSRGSLHSPVAVNKRKSRRHASRGVAGKEKPAA
jgi:hypothetical protein